MEPVQRFRDYPGGSKRLSLSMEHRRLRQQWSYSNIRLLQQREVKVKVS